MKSNNRKKKMTAAYHLSLVRLTLNYELLYDMIREHKPLTPEFMRAYDAFRVCLKKYLSGEDILPELDKLRGQVIEIEKILVSFLDYYQLYQQVTGRRKGKYSVIGPSAYSDAQLARRACVCITGGDGGEPVTARIGELLKYLPVRLTKQKFFDYLTEGLQMTAGGSAEVLDRTVDRLMEKLVPFPNEELMEARPDLYDELKRFEAMDYQNLSLQAYDAARKTLDEAIMGLTAQTDLVYSLQLLINDIYAAALALEEVTVHAEEEVCCRSILLTLLNDSFDGDPEDLFTDQNCRLEGAQEAYIEEFNQIELPPETPERMKDPDYVRALNVRLLHSGSQFMELYRIAGGPEDTAPLRAEEKRWVDRSYLDKKISELAAAAKDRFSGADRLIVRGIMGNVLSALPVFLNTYGKLYSFILGSLESCWDEDEKNLCKRSLETFLNTWERGEAGFGYDGMDCYEDYLA